MLHANIWESVQFTKLSRDARLFFIGLITIADDDGRFKANCSLLRSKIFPLDEEVGAKDVEKLLEETVAAGLVSTYKIDQELFGYHPNWEKYQTLRADRKKESSIPPPPSIEAIATKRQPSGNQVATKRPHKIREDKIREGNITAPKGAVEKPPIELPSWLNKKKWEEWIDYRKARRLSSTLPTLTRQIAFLERFKGEHESIIEKSIMNGWQGLFEPNKGVSGKPQNVLKTENTSKLVKAMQDKAAKNG